VDAAGERWSRERQRPQSSVEERREVSQRRAEIASEYLTLARRFVALKVEGGAVARMISYILKIKVALAFAVAISITVSAHAFADDDWEAVPGDAPAESSAPPPAQESPANPPAVASRHHGSHAAPGAGGVMIVCGEKAVAPSEKIQSIVSQINGAWGSDVRVYQSIAPEGPHAMPGGCIFYNPAALATLLGMRLDLTDPEVMTPMLYAIFAHEVGHEVHRDFSSSRITIPSEVRELEADRFSGYTMQKLGVPATGLSPYWSMTGDEFGAGPKHGSSEQRVAAFREGWHEAEWNRAESSTAATAATQESVAPEDSTAAP
jgi:hypothetical protein